MSDDGRDSVGLLNTLGSIRLDMSRYGGYWTRHPGFWVTLSYRVRRLRKFGGKIFLLLFPLDILLGFIRFFISDSSIPSAILVGGGLYLPHPNGLIFNHRVKIGNNVAIFQQVTLGEWRGGAPVIEDGCAIYAGAKVFGDVVVGTQSKLGANVVVNSSIPPFSSVAVQAVKISSYSKT